MSAGHVIGHPKTTAVVAAAKLLFVFGSDSAPLTTAVFVIVEAGDAVTFTTSVTVAVLSTFIEPSEQLTVPVPPTGGVVHVPWLVMTAAKV